MDQVGGYGHFFKMQLGLNCVKQENKNILEMEQKF